MKKNLRILSGNQYSVVFDRSWKDVELTNRLSLTKSKHGVGRVRIVLLFAVVLSVASIPVLVSRLDPSPRVGGGRGGGGDPYGFSVDVVYPNFTSLKGDSNIVVVANAVKVNSTYCVDAGRCETIGTIYELNVSSYLKGSGPRTIYMSGPRGPGDPDPMTGNEFVLFLVHFGLCGYCSFPLTPRSITYGPLGGAGQGMFLVRDGLVFGLKTLYPLLNDWVRVDANGVPLDQFVARVQAV